MAARCWRSFLHCLFDYETPKTIVVYNQTVGTVCRLIQILIIAYVIGYVCLVQKGYQEMEVVVSSVVTKVKGYTATNTSTLGLHVWDVPEFIIPPQGDDSFFVLTNMIVTPGQFQQACPEVPSPTSICESDGDCSEGRSDVHGNGVQTGLCVNYSDTVRTCQVLAWCPHEDDSTLPRPALLEKAEHFTVLIKNSVRYPKFGFIKRNILAHINKEYLKTCIYNSTTDPHCPIFRLGDMVKEAGEDFQTMAENPPSIICAVLWHWPGSDKWNQAAILPISSKALAISQEELHGWESFLSLFVLVKGGIMGILIDWSCDLDWSWKYCVPKYSFVRMDKGTKNMAPGFNFRFAKYFNNGSVESRTLIKGFGIRFDVIVFGMAGKFSLLMMIVNLGAALSFLSLVPPVCDWFLVTCTNKKDLYIQHKTTYLFNQESDGESIPIGGTYGTS